MESGAPVPGKSLFDPAWAQRRSFVYLAYAVLSLFALSSTWRVSMEDAYITYTYARNLAEGSGFVFNAGEPVFGTTTPLYTLLLAGLARVLGSGRIVEISCVLSCLGLFLQAALFYELFRKPSLAGVGAVIGAGILLNLTEAYWYTGMETNLFGGVLLLLVWLLFAANRSLWGGLVAGIIVLFRYDGFVFVAVAYLVWLFGTERENVKNRLIFCVVAACIGFLVFLPWFVYAWQEFGSPLPTSLAAKQGHHTPLVYIGFQLIRFGQFVDTFARPHSSLFLSGRFLRNVISVPEILMVWALAMLGWARLSHLKGWPLFLLIFPFVFVVTLSFMAPPVTHSWHIYPAQMCLFPLIVMGAYSVWVWAQDILSKRGASIARGGLWAVLAVFGVSVVWSGLGFQGKVAGEMWFGLREVQYDRIAEYLNRNAKAGSTVLHAEVGYIGFHTRCRMIDRVGLITPELRRPGKAELEDLADVVNRVRPDYVVVRVNDRESAQRLPDYEKVVEAGTVELYRRRDFE